MHGYREPGKIIDDGDAEDLLTEQEVTRKVANSDYQDYTILMHNKEWCGASETDNTERAADVTSKKIRDSVEFTS